MQIRELMEGRYDQCVVCGASPAHHVPGGPDACDFHYTAVAAEARHRREQAEQHHRSQEEQGVRNAKDWLNNQIKLQKTAKKGHLRREIEAYKESSNEGPIKIPPYPEQSPWEDRDDYLEKMFDWADSSEAIRKNNEIIKQVDSIISNKIATFDEVNSALNLITSDSWDNKFTRDKVPKELYNKLVDGLSVKKQQLGAREQQRQQEEQQRQQEEQQRQQEQKLKIQRDAAHKQEELLKHQEKYGRRYNRDGQLIQSFAPPLNTTTASSSGSQMWRTPSSSNKANKSTPSDSYKDHMAKIQKVLDARRGRT